MQLDKCKIALIGRTNVGKSTLFNRLTGSRDALVFNEPGVTRDIREKALEINGKSAFLIDTPGMFDYAECEDNPELLEAIATKLNKIVTQASLIVFVIDGDVGLTPYDKEISILLRKNGKDVIVAINKSDKKSADAAFVDAMSLGFSNTIDISAEHGLGIDELCDIMDKYIPEKTLSDDQGQAEENIVKLAIVGRPNVGKSTMVNKIIGEDRQLVADFAGLTRESAFVDFVLDGRTIRLIDTPGIRRKARVHDVLEHISVANSRNSYRRADSVILVIDATTLQSGQIEKQDLTLASDILKAGKALVIAFNKCDKTLYKINGVLKFLKHIFEKSLSQLKEVPFIFVSAQKGDNITRMLEMAISAYDKQAKRIKTSDLNNWLMSVNRSDILQSGSARFKLKYITQVGSVPPTFLIFVTNKKNIRLDHERFILNNLKLSFDLVDIAIKIIFREPKK